MQVFAKEFSGTFKKDPDTLAHYTIPLSRYITDIDNEWLTRDVTEEETRQIVNQINPLKALGPDDMHAIFYQKCWLIIGKNIRLMITIFLKHDHIHRKINKTHVTLIQKKESLKSK